MRRRMTYGRALIEVYQELTTVGNGAWVVPAGCVSVDAFLVAGGAAGSGGDHNVSGAGGRGGQYNTFLNIPVNSGSTINYYVGARAANTWFMSTTYQVSAGAGANGGAAITSTENTVIQGKAGGNGGYAFGSTIYSSNRYGAGGGGGAYEKNSGQSDAIAGGIGGITGGGKGGNATSSGGANGGSASFYGGGGGGGSKRSGSVGTTSGGNGYQGIIILRYKKYK